MYRLLVADDELIERKVLFKTLTDSLSDTCEIYQAENGREALEIFDEKDIQIAILDIEMPGINGIEAAQEMRRRKEGCCLIFLTAFDEFSYAKKAIQVKALDYLLKPYDDEELLLVVEEAIRLIAKGQEYPADKKTAAILDIRGDDDVSAEISPREMGQLRTAKVVEVIEEYIRDNYSKEISMQDVAREVNYSDAYFCKFFKQCFEMNFTTYLTRFRVEEAKRLLLLPTINIKEIGGRVGYPDSNYFAKVFKRMTGKTPTEYRLQLYAGS